MHLARGQLRSKGSIDSSLARHIEHALTTITLRRRKLSIVSSPPSNAIHPKAITLGGAFVLHKLPQKERLSTTTSDIEKKEDTEKKAIRGSRPDSSVFALLRDEDTPKDS